MKLALQLTKEEAEIVPFKEWKRDLNCGIIVAVVPPCDASFAYKYGVVLSEGNPDVRIYSQSNMFKSNYGEYANAAVIADAIMEAQQYAIEMKKAIADKIYELAEVCVSERRALGLSEGL